MNRRCKLAAFAPATLAFLVTWVPLCDARPAIGATDDTAGAVAAPKTSASRIEYIEVDSAALKRPVSVGVYLPPGYAESGEARFPTLYFLHGMRGSSHKWEQRGTQAHVDRLIDEKAIEPMIVVCPSGENSFYMKWADGSQDWEAFIVKELVAAIDAKYRTMAERSKRGITGDSMGGFGSLNLGLRNPKVYGSISAHSAALLPEDPSQTPDWMKRFGKRISQIFGDPPDVALWQANNPIHMARETDDKVLKSVAIYFDCGEDDGYGFDVGAKSLHDELEKRGIGHEYHLRKGNHGADYYIKYVDYSLAFHGAVFAGRDPLAGKTGDDEKAQDPKQSDADAKGKKAGDEKPASGSKQD